MHMRKSLECNFSKLQITNFFCRKRRIEYHRNKGLKEKEKHEEEVRRQAIENEFRAKMAGRDAVRRDKNFVITAASAAAASPKHTKVIS